mgnify:CR=1 FL=1
MSGANNDAVLSLVAALPICCRFRSSISARARISPTPTRSISPAENRELIANADVIMGLDVTDLYGALVRTDPNDAREQCRRPNPAAK